MNALSGFQRIRMDRKVDGEVLLWCLGMGPDGLAAGTCGQLAEHCWDHVVQQSVRHGMTPFVYHRSKVVGRSSNIPAHVMQRLRMISLQSAQRSMRLYGELSDVLRVLRGDGIAVIVLKGAHLGEIVYGNRALRPMGDVDLLVRKTELSKVAARLVGLGYRVRGHPPMEGAYARHHHLPPLIKAGGVKMDVHWTIHHPTAPFSIDVEGLWRRARPATIAGVEVLVLSPEDLLLHLCLHGSFSQQFGLGLRCICDISGSIRHYRDEMDWEQVEHRAHKWGVGKYTYLTLRLAKELLDTAVPGNVLDSLKPEGFNPQVVAWARAEIFGSDSFSASLSSNLAQLWGPRRLRDKAALFLKSLFPSPERIAGMYPAAGGPSRIYLYYPVRWKDLLLQYGLSAWRLMRHDEAMMVQAMRENQRTALRNWLAPVR